MPIPEVDMLGQHVGGAEVIRRVPSIGTGARWELLLACGHKQIYERKLLRSAIAKGTEALHCQTCKPRRSSQW